MTPILVCYALLLITFTTLVYCTEGFYWLKIGCIYILVFLGVFCYDFYSNHRGAPIAGYPEDEFEYVHHEIVGHTITLWTTTEDLGDRLYSFLYSQEVAEKLQEAKEKEGEGLPQGGSFIESEGGSGSPGLELDDWVGPNERITK